MSSTTRIQPLKSFGLISGLEWRGRVRDDQVQVHTKTVLLFDFNFLR